MPTYLRNRTSNYAWILGRRVSPGDQLDLDEIFKGYCEPKISSRDDLKKLELEKKEGKPISMAAEFAPDEFDEFVDWVENDIAVDRGIWEIIRDATKSPKVDRESTRKLRDQSTRLAEGGQPKPAVAQGRRGRQTQQVLAVQDIRRKIPSQVDLTPRDIAWLPYNEQTKKLISDMSADNIRDLKAAFRLVRNLSGQERTRKLIEDRINELATEGIA